MLVMIDNYDSFTYNVVQYLSMLGQNVNVFRNDEISISEIERLQPEYIVISPGPCRPDMSGISMDVIEKFKDKIPILGICLGHQCIGQIFGAKIVRAEKVMHGKVSMVNHCKEGMFKMINNPIKVTRYHSLIIESNSLPDCLEVIAWIEKDDKPMYEIMGIKHKKYPIYGVQFHPESIMSEQGSELLQGFLDQS